MAEKKRYVQVGTGGRGSMYTMALVGEYRATAELAGVCDLNPGRARLFAEWARGQGAELKTYGAGEFERMIAECRPDTVIVTSKDCTHDEYICQAMELGCDVITEKPMTIDETKCQRILETRKRTGRSCRVTFNYRYSPPTTQVKDLLMSGVIGEVLSIDFHWMLNTTHGADYFRRWHRRKENTGGLQVHKATHHFDIINWWLSSAPREVYATGGRNFYTPQMAERLGLKRRGKRCLGCAEAEVCPFFFDLRAYPELVSLYLENEAYDGYQRDGCVFAEEIDIEDTLHVVVGYQNGVQMSYSLHAYLPWEGHTVSFNGTRGRLEHSLRETTYINGDGQVPGELLAEATRTRVIPAFQTGYDVPIWTGEGGHGGGDPRLLEDLFSPNPPADPYQRAADERAGAYSILVGAAINRSLEWGRAVRIDELVPGLEMPEYPPMPERGGAIDPREFRPGGTRLEGVG